MGAGKRKQLKFCESGSTLRKEAGSVSKHCIIFESARPKKYWSNNVFDPTL